MEMKERKDMKTYKDWICVYSWADIDTNMCVEEKDWKNIGLKDCVEIEYTDQEIRLYGNFNTLVGIKLRQHTNLKYTPVIWQAL